MWEIEYIAPFYKITFVGTLLSFLLNRNEILKLRDALMEWDFEGKND